MANPRAYERKAAAQGIRDTEDSLLARDIGPPPLRQHPRRWKGCEGDFRRFCRTYFPDIYSLPFSDDHLKVIAQIEDSVLRGGLFATAMPRGAGKTSLCEQAAEWSILYGHRSFVMLIGSDASRSEEMLASIKVDLESNDLLLEDFPEAVFPIRKLEGIAHRCKGQLCRGERTHIGWSADEIVMPTMPKSKASGAVIKTTGITGGIRGVKVKKQDGSTMRPSLVIVDDPQTDESARSPSQCEGRERILAGAILGLAGPGKKISGIMPCTVIHPGDMADRILDRGKHPEWNGTRTKMMYALPADEKLWEEYARIRAESLRAERGGVEATEFYREHRAAMDAGARVAWEARFNPDELSAIQHAMNLKLRDERSFASEYQNDPLPDQEPRPDDLSADQVAAKLNRMKRGEVPTSCNHVTAMIDIQASLLFYVVVAWEDNYTGYVIDYGSYPDQGMPYYTLRDARITLASVSKTSGLEGQIYAGLEAIGQSVLSRDWPRDDGANLKIGRCLIDANWADSTASVYLYCRQSALSSILLPSRGKGIGASMSPMRDWAKRPGEKIGLNWKIGSESERKSVRRVIYDTNFWKSFVHSRLSTAMGDRGCLSIFGTDPREHRMFADQLCSEYRVRTQGRGRECDEWKLRPNCDNHMFDCLVGAAVAASIEGVSLAETGAVQGPKRRKVVSFEELQRRARSAPARA